LLAENVEKKRPVDKKKQAVIIASSVISVLGLLILGVVCYTRKTYLRTNDNSEERKEDMELPMYDLNTIAHATNNFSSMNKLGEGGFGPVFKVNRLCYLCKQYGNIKLSSVDYL